jgi:hypothetical protein
MDRPRRTRSGRSPQITPSRAQLQLVALAHGFVN